MMSKRKMRFVVPDINSKMIRLIVMAFLVYHRFLCKRNGGNTKAKKQQGYFSAQ